ncbi:SDR family NAD(P)-dependent oxidoreductase, partial [Acinetobacter baumannii]
MNKKLEALFQEKVQGKVILVTGASSGIGLTISNKLADAGAHVLLVARTQETLEEVKADIESRGGQVSIFPCDLNDMEMIDQVSKEILASVDHIDILINNAGRSIRRAVHESYDRFHDFERTMQLNYFGAVRLVLNILPHMIQRKDGQIINISSIGVLANATRFSAYVASKAALDAFSRCLSAEVHAHKIAITSIYMPLVRTPMIAPTKIYKYVPTLSPEQAADLIAY